MAGRVHLRPDDSDAVLAAWTEFRDTDVGIRSVKVTEAATEMRAADKLPRDPPGRIDA